MAAGAAFAVHSRAARYSEIEERIARKDFRGITKADLGTPCLVLEEAIFQRNLETMAAHCKTNGIQLRPHVKVHKLTQVSQRQAALGAIGITAATIAECELFHSAGIRGILYSAQPAGRNKIGRTAVMGRRAPDFLCVVDDPLIADELDEAAAAERTRLNVLVDLSVSMPRQGTEAGETALALAQKVDRSKHLKLVGLMGYSGVASHTKGWENRKRRSEGDLAPLIATAELCRKSGLPVKIITGGSTGTYNIDCHVAGMTELQAGSFVFMDSNYRRIGSKDGSAVYSDFGPALSVLSTVISKRRSQPGHGRLRQQGDAQAHRRSEGAA